MAAGKWSGSIEYQAKVLISLRSVAGSSDVIEAELPKNKHAGDDAPKKFYLQLSRSSQTLQECVAPEVDGDGAGDGEASRGDRQRDARAAVQIAEDAAALAVVLARAPGTTARQLRAACRAASGTMSNQRVDTAIAALRESVVCLPGPYRSMRHYIDGGRVPDDIMRLIQGNNRMVVLTARPPERDQEGSGD